jgi:putative ABC transport system permease protein
MLKSYLKSAFRNLLRNKTFSVINILGLSVGIAAFFLIIQYVTYEQSYDSFNKNADRIYRIRDDRIYSDKHDKSAGCPPALGPTLQKEFPEILESARVYGAKITVLDAERKISENLERAYYAEPSFLKIFSFPMLKGTAEAALEEPYSLILSKSIQQRYFDDENPVNEVVTVVDDNGNHLKCKVTGVFKDVPHNSHIKFDVLISYKTLIAQNSQAAYYWGWNAFNTYVLLAPNTDVKALQAKFPAMVEKYKDYGESYRREYLLQPLKDIHLHSHLRFEPEVNGDARSVQFLSIIAAFVLILAWVNYANLSTSRSLTRAREVGVRKVLGSDRLQLITQFMTESVLLNITAVAVAVVLDEMALPYFKEMTGNPLSFSLLRDNWVLLISAFALGVFFSGIYPALILSSFSPLTALNAKYGRISKRIDLRKALVISQFAVSIALIAATLVVYRQLSFMRNQDLGANIDQVLILKAPRIQGNFVSSCNTLKDALLTLPSIKNVAASATIPGRDYSNYASDIRSQRSEPGEGTQGVFIDVDENYFGLYQIPFIAGKNFSRESRLYREVILSEEAAKTYGFQNPEDAIDKKLVLGGLGRRVVRIIGVTRDYHQRSLKSALQPVIFDPIYASDANLVRYFSIKLAGQNIGQTMNQIKGKWDELYADQPFEYSFLDDLFDSQYKSDQQFGEVFSFFAALAILISCIGLFGLASYANVQRTREIGIRKAIGASIREITFMLVKDSIRWVVLANVIAWPVVYVVMNRWLEGFAYRVDVGWWVFVLSGMAALLIAVLSVAWLAIRAANANPVEALRYE